MAEYRVHSDPLAAQSRLQGIQNHLQMGVISSVSELFDGTAPHEPRGAPAQAWSVACIVEAWWKLEKAKKIVTSSYLPWMQQEVTENLASS